MHIKLIYFKFIFKYVCAGGWEGVHMFVCGGGGGRPHLGMSV